MVKKQKVFLLAILLLLSLTVINCVNFKDSEKPVAVEDFPNPFKQNERLGRGVNVLFEYLGWQGWRTLEEGDLQLIKEAGFDAVRIPIKWSAFASSDAPYNIEPSFFKSVDHVVELALFSGLVAVINIQAYHEFDENPTEHKGRFLAIWEQIADHYKTYPGDLFFDVKNEPHGKFNSDPSLWNQIQNEVIEIMRKTNPNRTIIVGPVFWNNIKYLDKLELPEDDRNLIVTFHFYEPVEVTHQGADWLEGSEEWLGTTWTGTPEEKQFIIQKFDKAVHWAKSNNRPLYLGEFGVYYEADLQTRVNYISFVREHAEELGISWVFWEFFCYTFGIYDGVKKSWNKPLLEAFIPPED